MKGEGDEPPSGTRGRSRPATEPPMKRTKILLAVAVIGALFAYRYAAGTRNPDETREVPSVVPEEA